MILPPPTTHFAKRTILRNPKTSYKSLEHRLFRLNSRRDVAALEPPEGGTTSGDGQPTARLLTEAGGYWRRSGNSERHGDFWGLRAENIRQICCRSRDYNVFTRFQPRRLRAEAVGGVFGSHSGDKNDTKKNLTTGVSFGMLAAHTRMAV